MLLWSIGHKSIFCCLIQFAVHFFDAVAVEWNKVIDQQALLAIVDGIGKFSNLRFAHAVGAQ